MLGWHKALSLSTLITMNPFRKISAIFADIPAPVRGSIWMAIGASSVATVSTAVRYVSAELHPFEISFFRNLFSLMFMLPWFVKAGLGALKTDRFGMHLFRTVIGLAAMYCMFTALSLMPVADYTALSFTVPLFATIGAAVILGEVVRLRRWMAIGIGFIGAMIIIRPGVGTFETPALIALASAVLILGTVLVLKTLSRTESAGTMVLYMALLMTPISFFPALYVWQTPTLDALTFLVIGAFFSTVAQLSLARAFSAADASAVLPFDFFRLITAAALGFLFFSELPDIWTWVGAGIIFSATLYNAHREAMLSRKELPVKETLSQPALDGTLPVDFIGGKDPRPPDR